MSLLEVWELPAASNFLLLSSVLRQVGTFCGNTAAPKFRPLCQMKHGLCIEGWRPSSHACLPYSSLCAMLSRHDCLPDLPDHGDVM